LDLQVMTLGPWFVYAHRLAARIGWQQYHGD
jgi:hypothetical protein